MDVIDCRNADVSTGFYERHVHSTTNTARWSEGKGAFHTEEVGFRCEGVPAPGGASKPGEALCKGCDGVAAFDISQ